LDQIADVAVIALFAIPAGLAFVTHSPVTYVVGAGLAAIAGWKISAALSADNPRVFTQFLSSRVPRLVPLFTPGLLSKIYALSLMRLANLTAITLMVHLASEAGTVGATLVAVPLVTLAISAAMLPGSFGVAEWSFTGVFAGFGTSAGEITAFVLANRLILTSLGILIGLFAALVTARKLVTANRISPPEMQLP
jgi:uncharacterized membrane protein YbhN (UPF0104 family)